MIKSTISTIKDNWWVIEIHCMTFFREQLWWDGIHLMNLVYLETKLNVRPVYVNTRVDPLTTSWLWKSAAKSDSIRSTKWIIFVRLHLFTFISYLFTFVSSLFTFWIFTPKSQYEVASQIWQKQLISKPKWRSWHQSIIYRHSRVKHH